MFKVAEAIMKRSDYMLEKLKLGPFDRTYVSMIGAEDSFGTKARPNNAREAVIWMAVQHRRVLFPSFGGIVPLIVSSDKKK